MSCHKQPILGKAYLPFSSSMVDVTIDNVYDFYFKKLVVFNRREYALFIDGNGKEIMQSLQAVSERTIQRILKGEMYK